MYKVLYLNMLALSIEEEYFNAHLSLPRNLS